MMAGGAGALVRRRPDPGRRLLDLDLLRRASLPPGGDPEFAEIPGLTPRITSIPNFYVVDEALFDPDLDPLTWRLEVSGLVERPMSLSYEELTAMPAVERFQTLECISNEIGGDLISTARWAGVQLAHVLDLAGIRPGAVEVAFRSADGYSESHPIDTALDPETLLVLGMNGHVLPRSHGFPARLLTVGTYGMKNPKWLMSIEVLDRPYRGFWERRGWSKAAVVKTGARIDTPISAAAGAPTDLAGIAFGGDRGVSGVEVSIAGGPWRPALLETAASPFTWVRWRSEWTPQTPGAVLVRARAIDGAGVVQTEEVTDPHPDGASGYHAIRVEVTT
jgi:DMSO/TMAO reductase YedYZ molybdopterin-dependent catalytic subunit